MRSPALGISAPPLSSAPASPYPALEEYLNEQWRQQRNGIEVGIRCVIEENRLLVGVEHAIAVQPPVNAIFARLKDLLEATPTEIWDTHPDFKQLPESLPVRFFIRVLNQKKSYSKAEETIQPLSHYASAGEFERDSLNPTDDPTEDESVAELFDDPDFAGEVALEPEVAAAFSPNHLRLEPLPEEAAVYGDVSLGNASRLNTHQSNSVPKTSSSLAIASQESVDSTSFGPKQSAPSHAATTNMVTANTATANTAANDIAVENELEEYDEESEEIEERVQDSIHIPRSIWAAGLGLCLMTFAGSFYVASRPCWFRTCPPLMAAQEELDQATNMLQVASTWEDLEQARQQLTGVSRELRAVPGWTSYGEQARGLRARNRRLLKSLTPIQDALKQADSAQEKSGTGTLKIKQWQEVLVHWEAAIAQLRGVAPESPMYALAQDKLTQYEANLEISNSRLAEEQEAQRLLSEARNFASEAPNKNDDIETLEFLQRTQIKLQDALYTLRKVPRGTTGYKEAVRLMSRYESELALNQGQQTREEFIVNSYRDALNSAESAKISEANERWTDARDHWKAAITSVNQIPSASSYFAQAQGLLSEYSYALQKAEEKAEQYAALQAVRDELAGICDGSPVVCRYEVTTQLIAVTLTLEYERAILTAGSVGDESSRISALNHVHSLETSLEKTSNQAQIPLELYDPDGVLVGTHEPRGLLNAI